jgi:hypothetical protein
MSLDFAVLFRNAPLMAREVESNDHVLYRQPAHFHISELADVSVFGQISVNE